ncbi:MAG: phasin family protein [Caldilineaceae bacterium]|nr:phasin family protein [Caldilineaceae bacterium]MCB0189011.1 phasin family protein [Caldilineaceae bacterium]
MSSQLGSSQAGSGTIPVIDVHNEESAKRVDLFSAARRFMLAGLGAVALTVDEANALIDKLADRGEVAESETEQKLKVLRSRLRRRRKAVLDAEGTRAKVAQTLQVMEEGIEEILHSLNVPSKHDVEKLQAELDRLHQKIDSLAQQN